ncbi:MAG: hydroxymethylbilane synthase [Thermoleophilaceae bacterium]
MSRPLRIGTRGSPLALAQARHVAALLGSTAPDVEVELVAIRTSGDERVGKRVEAPPPFDRTDRGDKARFVKEIEEALLRGEVDLAVHSAKDVPGELPDGLAIVGVPERGDPADALCGDAATLDDLPSRAIVGTASLRRRAQLLAFRPDLDVRSLRGNVDTRLGRLGRGDYAAIVLAAAGLERLGRSGGTPLGFEVMTPAPGQGCLALEARAGDERPAALADRVTHRESLLRLTAERALVAALDATCRTPVGAHAELGDEGLTINAFAGLPDGSAWVHDAAAGPADAAAELGRSVAERLLAAGAGELLAAAERWEEPLSAGPPQRRS